MQDTVLEGGGNIFELPPSEVQGGTVPEPAKRKIAVLGSAVSSAGLAPFGEPEWEIWGCSPANKGLPRVDVWFELHNPDVKIREGLLEWMQWLKTQPIVYMQKAYEGYPGAESTRSRKSSRSGVHFGGPHNWPSC